ncbi:hypothetical protein MJO28_009688 [Puccinia striiformis f. sp. tritici]|uniref:Translation initiation factor eIF2B subunit alpha n=3 Tax=Puccinia striiformis f. sp. tritici TaxID=168172 RepID=A0A0L0V8A5_9BASI|nr:hypothetical protein MJO29_016744 [Puccinia striiformis f. sp. tritici]KAI7947780.1 hypothetical protein MJO28_009688 [Puccinia striiformis f. sp. tritici]KAI7950811.1 hypothetical protein MJO29_009485 [Puccinia striiformis f. sp. tritici]KAI9607364.1 hypothetical protein H4Q26_005883 [Puccinia striiformis f. sp. tritici PST-130]KNE95436.1 hypothetical protein PSTG_11289 [Puccinia striiformis f. sp. tritici PST-78]
MCRVLDPETTQPSRGGPRGSNGTQKLPQEFGAQPKTNRASNMTESLNISSPSPPHGDIEFDVVRYYHRILEKDENLAVPIAAVQCLSECVAKSTASTMQELIGTLYVAIDSLKQATSNLISLTAGCDLFLRFLMTHQSPDVVSFADHKHSLVNQALKYVAESRSTCVEKVASSAARFIEDGSTIMVHGYSRVVLHTLIKAYSPSEKPRKRFQVFVTESRPSGLGLKTHAILEQFGIPCVVLLDSAVAYTMAKVDLVLVGAEAVLEDGGLINYIGCYQMAIAAKAHHKPFYALTESYKFLRLFPLSQYDVPTKQPTLQFPSSKVTTNQIGRSQTAPSLPGSTIQSQSFIPAKLTLGQIAANNPTLDYTTPDLITLVISDSGILTPPGVAEVLLSIFGGE